MCGWNERWCVRVAALLIATIAGVVPGYSSTFAEEALEGTSLVAWNGPEFSATPQEILADVAKLETPDHLDLEILLDETTVEFESDGRRIERLRTVMRVLTEAGVDSQGGVSVSWSPWFQRRPTIRARVINTDGSEVFLNDSEIVEGAVEQEEHIFSDDRQLQAPLPAIEPGSVIETVTEIADERPQFGGGVSYNFHFNKFIETHEVRLRVIVPTGLPFQHVEVGPGLSCKTSDAGSHREFVWTSTARLGFDELEAAVPQDIRQVTTVSISTGRSWNDVARGYADIVKTAISNHQLADRAKEIVGNETDKRRQIDKLLAFVRQQVRYTGLMFGNGSFVPTPPDETLRRRYGDCKDQSLLLVALLQSIGLDAAPVLVRSSFGVDVMPELPGLGGFNHLIVHVADETNPAGFWIDPTASYVPLGELPIQVQGRLCLIVRQNTERLERSPESLPKNLRCRSA